MKRSREVSTATTNSNSEVEFAEQVATISPISNRQHYRERAIDCGGMSPVLPTRERVQILIGKKQKLVKSKYYSSYKSFFS